MSQARNKLVAFGFSLSLMVSGCVVYHPQTADIPLISNKGDLRLDAGISIIPTAHATVSYGMTEKMAVQLFGSIGSDDRYYMQAAAGLYKNRGTNRILELYGGFGYGYGDAYRDANPGDLVGNYQLYFGQLNYGTIAGETSNLEIGIGIKTGYLHSNMTDINYYDWISMTGPYITYHDESLLLEPAGFIRMGGKKLRFSIKLGSTWIYKITNPDRHFPYYHLNLGLGLNYRF
jgi:hypothetical protein